MSKFKNIPAKTQTIFTKRPVSACLYINYINKIQFIISLKENKLNDSNQQIVNSHH